MDTVLSWCGAVLSLGSLAVVTIIGLKAIKHGGSTLAATKDASEATQNALFVAEYSLRAAERDWQTDRIDNVLKVLLEMRGAFDRHWTGAMSRGEAR